MECCFSLNMTDQPFYRNTVPYKDPRCVHEFSVRGKSSKVIFYCATMLNEFSFGEGHEGYRSSSLNKYVEGGISELSEAQITEIWSILDPEGNKFLTEQKLNFLVDECMKTIENVMRPVYAEIIREDQPEYSFTECNNLFDERFGFADASGSENLKSDLKEALLNFLGEDGVIYRDAFIKSWNEFARMQFEEFRNEL